DARAGATPYTAQVSRAGHYHQLIAPETPDLLGHALLGARPYRHHRDDGSDADDDAEYSEHAAERVDAEGPEGAVGVAPEHATLSIRRRAHFIPGYRLRSPQPSLLLRPARVHGVGKAEKPKQLCCLRTVRLLPTPHDRVV